MSSDDIDDMLLELAGDGDRDRKRKRRSPNNNNNSTSNSSKRRKAEVSGDSDDNDEEDSFVDPYPLEGKYVDGEDRQRLLHMPEIEREEILAQRAEEKQKLQDKLVINQMVQQQRSGGDVNDGVARVAKRQHTQRGATKEKTLALGEYSKARRKIREKRPKNQSPRRERSSSPMDMEISDDESEDGQITKDQQAEERERRLLKQISAPPAEEEACSIADIERCRLSRDILLKHCWAPWFDDYVENAWVRFLIGNENGQPVYRICQVAGLSVETMKPYKVDGKLVNHALDLRHGKSVRSFGIDRVSNAPFHSKEFERLTKVYATDEVKLPSKRALEKKAMHQRKYESQPTTESDINHMLKRKAEMEALVRKPTGLTTLERSRLRQEHTLALRRHDYEVAKRLEAKLAESEPQDSFLISTTTAMDATHLSSSPNNNNTNTAASNNHSSTNREMEALAKINDRNRKANLVAVRKAEQAEGERKRRERQAMLSGDTTGIDPSARLKTLPRMFNAASRPGTPTGGITVATSTAIATATVTAGNGAAVTATAKATVGKVAGGPSWEESFVDSVEVDLGDF